MNSFPFESCFIILLSRGKNESKKSIITKQEKEIANTTFHIWYYSESSNFENVRKVIQKAFFFLLFFPQDISLFFNAILKGFLQYSKNVLKYTSHKNHVVSYVLDGKVHLVSCGRGSLRESRKFSFINWEKSRATFGAKRKNSLCHHTAHYIQPLYLHLFI